MGTRMNNFILDSIKFEIKMFCLSCHKQFTIDVDPSKPSNPIQRLHINSDGFVLQTDICCPMCNKKETVDLTKKIK